jgi:hypothetical protein
MIKTLILSVATLVSLTLSGSADLGLTKAQIEAEYGKPVQYWHFPVTILGKDGKQYKVPGSFWTTYEDSQTKAQLGKLKEIYIHYNTKGIVNAVTYRAVEAFGRTAAPSEFTDVDFRSLLNSNGVTNWDRHHLDRAFGYPDFPPRLGDRRISLDDEHYLALEFYTTDEFGMYIPGLTEEKDALVSGIKLWTPESLVEFNQFSRQLEKFYQNIGGEGVYLKWEYEHMQKQNQ